MKYCNKCGAENTHNTDACLSCGNRFDGAEESPQVVEELGFGGYIQKCFKNYVNFSGRARRAEYWYFWLFGMIVNLILNSLAAIPDMSEVVYLTYIFALIVFLPSIAVSIRRLHDIGKSGRNLLWIFLPIIGGIMLIVWSCREGERGANQYGPDPLGRV